MRVHINHALSKTVCCYHKTQHQCFSFHFSIILNDYPTVLVLRFWYRMGAKVRTLFYIGITQIG